MRSSTNILTIYLILGVPLVQLAASELEGTLSGGEKDWVFLENADVRLGLLRSHGGAIGHLSLVGSDDNLLNHYDHGRLVQQSYYGNEDGSKWVDKAWRYNPVQGGDYRGSAAVVEVLKSSDTTAYAKTIPRHWAAGDLLEECVMEQWVELHGPIVHMRYRFAYSGSQTHKAHHQETPAVFVSSKLETLVTYAGREPWKDGALTRRVPGWPNEAAQLAEHWAAYVDENDQGVGVYVPGVTQATCYRYRGGSGSNCSYIAPLRTFSIEPGFAFSYRAYFTLGDVETIRQRFHDLHNAEK